MDVLFSDSDFLEFSEVLQKGSCIRRRILLDDLLYLESFGHRVIVHTLQRDLTTRCSLRSLSAPLLQTGRFYLNEKGILLNFSHVVSIDGEGEILLSNGHTLFCSRRRKRGTREAFFAYQFRVFHPERSVLSSCS